jgi:hypothetical protein
MGRNDRLFIVAMLLAAFTGGVFAGASLERRAADRAVHALQTERVAREGKTDREFYARHPDQIAGGVSRHERRH